MLKISRLSESDISGVLRVRLSEEQIAYAGTAKVFLSTASVTMHLYVIKYDNEIVGFFKLDLAYADTIKSCSERSIGLRALALDINSQGKGIGSHAMKALFSYLQEHYLTFDSLYLTVDSCNMTAVNFYQKVGFEFSDEMFQGGQASPAYII
jgi:ribosomal protein S18 acetylase RimI-like enzyme